MSVDLALPKKPEPIRYTSVKFKWPEPLKDLLAQYSEAYKEIRNEDISLDELAALIIEHQIAADKGFKQWSKNRQPAGH